MRVTGLMLTFTMVVPAALAGGINLEDTFFHDGNIDDLRWRLATIAVDRDGTVAVAVTGNIGAGNQPGVHRARILLYDKDGKPLAEIPCASNTGLENITFGPDGMIYTAESWFGSGAHVYDRPGGRNRFVEKRHLRADGSHVDRGSPSGIAVTSDGKIYTVCLKKVSLMSADDKLLEQVDWASCRNVDVTADGKVHSGSKVLVGKAWKDFKYFVLDIAADGRMLVRDGNGWGIYNPSADKLEVRGKYPAGFDVGDAALGPANRVYLTSRTDRGLAFAAIDADGRILFQRGADFDRLRVTLPGDRFTGGQEVAIGAATVRSRDLGFVPADRILPQDNRPKLEVRAALTPAAADPLAPRRWTPCTLTAGDTGKYALAVPKGLAGRFLLRISATRADVPGMKPLAVTREVTIVRPGQVVFLQPMTDRKRTAFAPGKALRLTVPVRTSADVDLSGV
ncbi:MAG: hypothetical protein WBF17_15190, partial [Phycisphaerae bacterium]